jgi:hypothetical protein
MAARSVVGTELLASPIALLSARSFLDFFIRRPRPIEQILQLFE